MKAVWQKIIDYYLALGKREQLLMLISLIFVITGLWYWLIWDVVDKKHNQYKAKISVLKVEQRTLQDDVVLETARIAKDPNVDIQKQKAKLQTDIDNLNKQLQIYSTQLLSSQGLMTAIKDITLKASNLELTSVDILPDKEEENTTDVGVPLYRHGVRLEFQADFFTTLTFLEQMEILPWRLFWDKIEYKVIKYPKAQVTLELHTLSEKTDGS